MEKLFATYADVDDPSIIGGQGLEKLCTDANVSMEGSQPLILAWLLEASELGKLTKEAWLKGFHALKSVIYIPGFISTLISALSHCCKNRHA
jgi:DCN1-like protein 4/5